MGLSSVSQHRLQEVTAPVQETVLYSLHKTYLAAGYCFIFNDKYGIRLINILKYYQTKLDNFVRQHTLPALYSQYCCNIDLLKKNLQITFTPSSSSPQDSTLSLPSLSSILPQLFRAVISNAGSLNETYHLTLGLLGQLLLRIPPMEADTAVTEALADKYELLTQGEAATSDTPGWRTTQLLFSLGAVCLDR